MFLGQIALRDGRIKVLEEQKASETDKQAAENKSQDISEDENKSAATQNEVAKTESQEEKDRPETNVENA